MGRHYDLLDSIRAFENQCFFISSDIVGMHGDHEFYGHSRITSPNGMSVAEAFAHIDIQQEIVGARSCGLVGLT